MLDSVSKVITCSSLLLARSGMDEGQLIPSHLSSLMSLCRSCCVLLTMRLNWSQSEKAITTPRGMRELLLLVSVHEQSLR